MKTTLAAVFFGLTLPVIAGTNTLELNWLAPPGFQSTLYCSTNLNSSWSAMGQVTPPVSVNPTNPMTFFYVSVAPTNQPLNFTGSSDPAFNAVAGSSYVNTNTGDWWLNIKGGTNGWVWEIAGE
jgi:hypothetical protein